MRRRLAPAWAGLLAAAALPLQATALPTSEPFGGGAIDTSRWTEVESWRRIDPSGRLHLGHWSLGTQAHQGTSASTMSLPTTRATAPRILAGTLQAEEVDQIGTCATNGAASVAQAWLGASLFNARQAGPLPGDPTGDVQARIGLRRSSTFSYGVVRVFGELVQCADRSCIAPNRLVPMVNLGSANVGDTVGLAITVDRLNRRVIYSVNGVPTQVVGYAFARLRPPSMPFVGVALRNDVANCAGTRVRAGMSVFVDDLDFSD